MVWLLLVAFQLKHFAADYPFQTPWMLRKFLGGTAWVLPLAAHAGVHAFGTAALAWAAGAAWPVVGALAVFNGGVHFVMDRIKASPCMLGRFKPLSPREYGQADAIARQHNMFFWWSLGLDQMVHHLTDIATVWWLVQ